jgi:hypothetical protein
MKYSASFTKTAKGNGVKEGSVLSIKVDGSNFFNGGIYQKGFPMLTFQSVPGDIDCEILVKRKGLSLKGKATLKVRAFDSQWRGAGWNDEFEIF